MSGKAPRTLSLVLVPALITLVVTVLRLYGELHDWPELWVGTREGGGGGGVLSITILALVFGAWFGWRLQRSGAGVASPKRALLLSLVAFGVFVGCMAGLGAAGLIVFPDKEHPVAPHGAPYMFAAVLLTTAVSFVAFRRAALTLFVYGILARIPVIVVTWIAVEKGWATHYSTMAEGFITPPHDELFFNLLMPQVMFWPFFTVFAGTVTASIGALLAGKPRG